jgi:hypothetical protein
MKTVAIDFLPLFRRRAEDIYAEPAGIAIIAPPRR